MTNESAQAVFTELLKARHSCRGFLPDQVPRDTIAKIVQTAQNVPSWCNSQPWQLAIASGKTTDRFRKAMTAAATNEPAKPNFDFPRQYAGIYKERRSATGWQLYDCVGVTKGDRAGSARQMMRNFALFDAPHVAIVTSEADLGTYGVLDCGAFVTAFTLAAQAHGVATIAQAALAGQAASIRSFFALPDNRPVVCGISFGYEDFDHPANQFRTERADPADVISWY